MTLKQPRSHRRWRFEYLLRDGQMISLPWFVWRWLPKDRRRRMAR